MPKENLGPKKHQLNLQPCSPGAPCCGGKSRVHLVTSARNTPAQSNARLLPPPGAKSASTLNVSNAGLLRPSSHGLGSSRSNASSAGSVSSYQQIKPYVDKNGKPKRFVCCMCGKGKYVCLCSSIDDFSSMDVTKSSWWLSQKSAMELLEQRRNGGIPRNESEFQQAEQKRLSTNQKRSSMEQKKSSVSQKRLSTEPEKSSMSGVVSATSTPVVESIVVPDMQPAAEAEKPPEGEPAQA